MFSEADVAQAVGKLNRIRTEIAKVIVGQQDVVDGVLICLLSGGHVLLEGVPGLGKTTLAQIVARDAAEMQYEWQVAQACHMPFLIGITDIGYATALLEADPLLPTVSIAC